MPVITRCPGMFQRFFWPAVPSQMPDVIDGPVYESSALLPECTPSTFSPWVAGCLVIKPPVWVSESTEARSLNHPSHPGQQLLYSFIPVHFHQFRVSIYQDYIKVDRAFGFLGNKRGRGGHVCNISTPLSVSVNPSLTARNWNLKNCNEGLGCFFFF